MTAIPPVGPTGPAPAAPMSPAPAGSTGPGPAAPTGRSCHPVGTQGVRRLPRPVPLAGDSSDRQPGAPRLVQPDDVPVLSRRLARAFSDDPVSRYIFPAERTHLARLDRYFRWQLQHVFLPKGEAWTTDDLAGASLWMPPVAQQVGVVQALGQLGAVVRILGRSTGRALRLLELLEARHPRATHCYLSTIGTDPDFQRRGVGSRLMKVVLDRLDEEAMASYLESSKQENLAFYHRHGYEVTGEIELARGGPHLWLMWREPRG